MTACGVGVDVLFGALGSELFPTSYRSTASGVRAAVGTVAGSAGLWLEGWLFPLAGQPRRGHHVDARARLDRAARGGLLLLPETARRELEEIAPAP